MKKIHEILAAISFLISFIIYVVTMAPTTSFWDCGEFIATSVIMGVPHPPGTPLFLLLGNFFSQLPFFEDLGARVNLISPIASAFSVMFLYLISSLLIQEWRGKVKTFSDQLIVYGSSFIGAMTFAVSDSHWFNAVEAEVYSISTFFTSIVVWLILVWNKNSGEIGNVRYIIIIAYMLGLATGIHLLNLLALPFIALIIFYNKFKNTFWGLLGTVFCTLSCFIIIYLGVIKGIPNMANDFGILTPILFIITILLVTIYAIYSKKQIFALAMTSLVMIIVGFSTYATIFIRASQHPSINENNPDSIKGALAYMNRDQYGDWSILDRSSTMKRQENFHWNRWAKDKNNIKKDEVNNFVWEYQFKEMYFRYFLWQFAGKESYMDRSWEVKKLDGSLIKKLQGIDWTRYGIPLALLFGLGGIGHHFYRDKKRALAVLSLFLATGLMIIVYLNQYDPQPRERDYSYVGSFFAFSIWISIGVSGLLERIREFVKNNRISKIINSIILVVIFFSMPFTMMIKDFHEHNRSGNYVAWDYAYNLLNSCEPNGILFTNGDNDTFPLWYLQEVEAVRKDVRVVNLSLLNTPWYIEQLKNQEPKIPLDLKDSHISQIDPIIGTGLTLEKWTSDWKGMKSQLIEYFGKRQLRYNIREHGIPMEWSNIEASVYLYDDPLSINLKPTISNYLRVQDFMILEIIDDIEKGRPIYFAVTVSPSNRVGLDKYLEMEGLVYRITSKESSPNDISPRLNVPKMRRNIMETNKFDFIIRTPEDYNFQLSNNEGLYRYFNLDNKDVYFNSNIQRLIQNYRSGFLQLGLNELYSTEVKGKQNTIDLLKKMDKYFPPDVIPISEPELDIQIGRIYAQAGDTLALKDRLNSLQLRSDLDLETYFYIGQVYINELSDYNSAIEIFSDLKIEYPFISDIRYALVQAYSQIDLINEAIEELEEWLMIDPSDEKAKQMIDFLKTQA